MSHKKILAVRQTPVFKLPFFYRQYPPDATIPSTSLHRPGSTSDSYLFRFHELFSFKITDSINQPNLYPAVQTFFGRFFELSTTEASRFTSAALKSLTVILSGLTPLQQDLFSAGCDSIVGQLPTIAKTQFQTNPNLTVTEFVQWIRENPKRVGTGYIPFTTNYLTNVGVASYIRTSLISSGVNPTVSGLLSGLVSGTILTPVEYLVTFKQSNQKPETVNNVRILRELLEKKKVHNLFRGAGPAALRDITFFGLLQTVTDSPEKESALASYSKAFFKGALAGGLTNGADALRAKVQSFHPSTPSSCREVLHSTSVRNIFGNGLVPRGVVLGVSFVVYKGAADLFSYAQRKNGKTPPPPQQPIQQAPTKLSDTSTRDSFSTDYFNLPF